MRTQPLRAMFQDRDGAWDTPTIVAFGIGGLGAFTVAMLVAGEFIAMLMRLDHAFHAQELGIGVGSVIGGLGPFLAGYAAYWASDAYNRREHGA